MRFLRLAATTTTLILSTGANAALVERLGGLAYYDTDADLTWLADANYAMTSGYDADGRMNWYEATAWAASLDIDGQAGADGWRLPVTLLPDPSCSSNGQQYCTGSEMGNMFYNVLGNPGYPPTLNAGPFSNLQSSDYWSSTENPLDANYAYIFIMAGGTQFDDPKHYSFYAWAVHSGDISAVPVPAAVWLFSSGLIGLAGLAKRKKR